MFKILKINKKVNIGPQKARFIRANFTNDQLKEYLKKLLKGDFASPPIQKCRMKTIITLSGYLLKSVETY